MSAEATEFDPRQVFDLVEAGDLAAAASLYQSADPSPDTARAIFGLLSTAQSASVLAALTDEIKARELLMWLPREQLAAIVPELGVDVAARLIGGLASDERADLLAALEDEPRTAIQAALPAQARADAAKLLKYEPDTAGGLMETEFLAFSAEMTVRDAIRDLRAGQEKYAAVAVQYLYVLDAERRLIGLAPIRDLMLAPEAASLGSLVKRQPALIRDTATAHEVAMAFDEHPFSALPVVDERGVMLGIVNRADATESEQEAAEDTYRVSQGIVGGEELRSMPVGIRLRRRTAWLGVNLVMCLGGAAVVALHQDTIAKALAVAAVLPVISATSGNAAMQAAAVSIRELTLGIIEPGTWRRVLSHELGLAALLALPMGIAVSLLAQAWGAGWQIGAAVGSAMALNALVAIGVGSICPLALRKVNVDPALASGPIVTTMADITGFALTLTFVAWIA